MGWLRNLPRKPWSVAVPYQSQGNVAPLYPDLLFFRTTSGGIVVDLLDPHLTALDDAAPKTQGLARYADEHGALFRRIELIQVKDKQVQRLDLTKPAVREKVKAVNTNDHLRHLLRLFDVGLRYPLLQSFVRVLGVVDPLEHLGNRHSWLKYGGAS